MLYDFHCTQNAKKPASVHATYLIAGTRRVAVPSPSPPTNGTHTSTNDDDDTIMRSSPPLPSSSIPHPDSSQPSEQEPQLIRSIMLVKEEHLPQAKASFDQISSIHIYSLEAHPLNDLQVLTECNRKVAADYASEDPLEAWKQYGTIQNSGTKRRTRRNGPPPPQPAPAAVASAVKKEDGKAKQTPPTTSKAEPKATTNDTHAAPASKPAQTKRQNSDIFKSFAKSKTKPKGSESQTTTSASPAAEPKDEAMGGFSDDNGDDDDDEDPPAEPATDGTTGKSKKERAAELQAMMDADEDDPDEEMQDADTPAAEAQPEEPEEEEEEEPSAPLDAPLKKPAADTKESETVTVENGRRRGRRRVMKKRTVKDEEGYLGSFATYRSPYTHTYFY